MRWQIRSWSGVLIVQLEEVPVEHTRFTAFFATAVIGLAAAQACAQETLFGDESELEVKQWDREGLYFSVAALLVLPEDSDIRSADNELNNILQTIDSTMEFELSAGVSAALGYEFASHYRGELQYSYMDVRLDELTTTAGRFRPEGYASVQTLMLNAYYDLPLTVQVEPYVGVGVGVAFHSANLSSVDGQPTGLSRGDDTTIAYQAMLGIGYKMNPTTTISAGTRYVTGDDPDFGTLTSEFSAWVFEFGIRFGF